MGSSAISLLGRIPIAARVAAAYVTFGAGWILGSDRAAAWLFPDPDRLAQAQSWKGLAFVGLSSALIYGLVAGLTRAMAHSAERYRSLFAASPEALLTYGLDDLRLLDANEAACLLLGFERAQLLGRRVPELLTAAGAEAFHASIHRLSELPHTTSLWRLVVADGREIDVATHGQTFRDHGRACRQVLLIDVTARLRSETELLGALDELSRANTHMRELGHAVSHDLQEPLRQVASFVQLLERRYGDELDSEARQYIGFAVDGVARLKALIGDLERFTRPAPVRLEMVATQGVVDRVMKDLARAVDSAGAQVEVGRLPRLRTDEGRLTVIFHALIDNAVKFRRADGPCHIGIAARPAALGGWTFRVEDNGIGIEPEFRAGVFSLFQRLHTRDRYPGNGLGLAMAKKMVDSLGGQIWVEPANAGGSVFSFTLPAAPEAVSSPRH